MIIIIKFITIFIGTITVTKSILDYFKKKNSNIIIYPEAVFYFFFYVPIILDLIFGSPVYPSIYWGFIETHDNFFTEIIYCIIILYILLMFRYFQKKNVYTISFNVDNKNLGRFLIAALMVLVLYCLYKVINLDIVEIVMNYEMRYYDSLEISNIKILCFVIVVLVITILALENQINLIVFKFMVLMPVSIFAFMLNGKRAVVFLFIVSLGFIVVLKRIFESKTCYAIFLIILVCSALLFQKFYSDKIFPDISSFEESYTSYRVNYGRDDTLKMAIYSELNGDDEIKILEYRGQTLLYYLTFYINRDNWEDKPYPYAVYFTSALVGLKEPQNIGWAMTTSIFDELLSNFSWIGIFLAPFIINRFCKFMVKRSYDTIGKANLLLAILLSVLAIAVQISAFLVFYILLVVLLIIQKCKKEICKYKGKTSIAK